MSYSAVVVTYVMLHQLIFTSKVPLMATEPSAANISKLAEVILSNVLLLEMETSFEVHTYIQYMFNISPSTTTHTRHSLAIFQDHKRNVSP